MSAILKNFKTRNQIYKDFKTLIQTALTEFPISGWDIKKLEQVIKSEELKPCIFMQITQKKQTGAQYRAQHKTENEIILNTDFLGFDGSEFKPFNQFSFFNDEEIKKIQKIYYKDYSRRQEVTLRISATRREKMNDTTETINGGDILDIILNYFQSLKGINQLAQLGYAQFRPTAVQFQSFTNDDENIQIMPHFDCVYQYTDTWYKEINNIENVRQFLIKGV